MDASNETEEDWAVNPTLPAINNPAGTATVVIALVLGLLALFFGRRLFYLFVALVGFVIGLELSQWLLFHAPPGPPQSAVAHAGWLQLLIGIIVGVLVAILAVLIQRPLAAISVFLVLFAAVAGGPFGGQSPSTLTLILAVLIGILGFVLVWIFFDWGLIVSSALAGAATLVFVVQTLTALRQPVGLLLFVVLIVLGVLFQASALRRVPA